MARFLILFCLVTISGVNSIKNSDVDVHKLPKLFHLDDFEQCLAKKSGVYCLGEFIVYSDQPNPIYDIIQRSSQNLNSYNRSYLHRGYCLSTRCPSREANATARFERCVDASARRYSLRARLRTLHYCRAHGQPRPRENDTTDLPHRVLLYFVSTILVMNVIGTAYDFYFAKEGNKNPLLMSFSLRMNWNHLTSDYSDMDPSLRDLQIFGFFRFSLGIGLILCHVIILTTSIYQYNPEFMEKFYAGPAGYTLGAGTVTTLMFVMISNFLTTYNILLMSESLDLGLKHFPWRVLKRVTRIYPAYLLLNGFSATWWKSFGDGPMWPVFLASESETCRKKFWVTAAFLQNFINKKELCLIQTWIIAVDMQLHLFILFMTLFLLKHREHAVKILSMLLAVATALLAYLAFKQDLIPAYQYSKPEILRNAFIDEDSFFNLYINPISGLIIAIAGSMLAFIYIDHQKRGIKMSRSKVMVFLHYLSFPALFIRWYLCYAYFKHYDRPTQNMMVVVERLIDAVTMSFVLYTMLNYKSILHNIAAWRPLQIITKMSLSFSMCHWCINVLIFTDRWTLHSSSYLQIVVDTVAVYVLAQLVALPLTLLVEYPLQNFLNRLINYTEQRWFSSKKKLH